MKRVVDDEGNRYYLVKQSADSSLVKAIDSGTERYVQNDRLRPVDASKLEVAAQHVDDNLRTLVTTVHDERTLGLLFELRTHGPLTVRELIDRSDFCESDLHGRFVSLVIADLLEECEVTGERGYAITEECNRALSVLESNTERNNRPKS